MLQTKEAQAGTESGLGLFNKRGEAFDRPSGIRRRGRMEPYADTRYGRG